VSRLFNPFVDLRKPKTGDDGRLTLNIFTVLPVTGSLEMKGFIALAWILSLLVSGCASSPPPPATESIQSPIAVPDTDKDRLILRQPGDASSAGCPPGQLMATRVVSGETGTRTTEECVTPFASTGKKYKRDRTVAIKLRHAGRKLKHKAVGKRR
jgi:hypothetical protein